MSCIDCKGRNEENLTKLSHRVSSLPSFINFFQFRYYNFFSCCSTSFRLKAALNSVNRIKEMLCIKICFNYFTYLDESSKINGMVDSLPVLLQRNISLLKRQFHIDFLHLDA